MAIEEVAQLFKAGGLQAVGLVDDEQFDVPCVAEVVRVRGEVVLDGGVETATEEGYVLVELARADGHGRRPQHAACLGEDRRPRVGVLAVFERVRERPKVVQHRGRDGVPVRVVARGEGLADAGWAVANTDVAFAPAGVGELGEAAVLLGDEKLPPGSSVGARIDDVVEAVRHVGYSSR